MSNAYKFDKEVSQTSFDYGGMEERIGFILDNYYDAMKIYRCIMVGLKEADAKREKAHKDLQKLRNEEARWNKSGTFPQDFDAEEHQARKDHLAELREMDYDIMYNDNPLEYDKLSHLVYTHMWVFRILYNVDFKVRGKLGPCAAFTLRMILWPMMKMMELSGNVTDDPKFEKYLNDSIKKMKEVPDKLKDKFIHP